MLLLGLGANVQHIDERVVGGWHEFEKVIEGLFRRQLDVLRRTDQSRELK